MRTVYATTIDIRDQSDAKHAMAYIGKWIHDWYRKHRSMVDILPNLDRGDLSIEPMEGHKLSLKHFAAKAFPNERLCDLKWEYPDQYDKTLGWIVNVAIVRTTAGMTISFDLAVTGLQVLLAPANIKLGSPRLIRDIARLKSVFIGGCPYHVAPEVIGADEVEILAEEIRDPTRPFPLVVVSKLLQNDRLLVDTSNLAERLAGVAKVFELADKWAAFRLTEVLTKPFSCFAGAIRIYWPRFSTSHSPFMSPLWMPWQFSDAHTSEAALGEIANRSFEAAAFRHAEPVPITRIRQAAAREAREEHRIQSGQSSEELLEDLISVEAQLKELQALHEELKTENEILRANAVAVASNWSESLSPQTINQPVQFPISQNDQPEDPTSVEESVKVAAARSKFCEFLPSAYEAASQSPYRHADRALQALLALEEVAEIWAESLSSGKSVGSLRKLFEKRGFNYADDVSQTSKGKWRGEYAATFRGEELDISPHITIGAKQADSCLSVHWAWHKTERKAIVAHVGRHKTNTKT